MFRGTSLTICLGCGKVVPESGMICPLCGDVLVRTAPPIYAEEEIEQEARLLAA